MARWWPVGRKKEPSKGTPAVKGVAGADSGDGDIVDMTGDQDEVVIHGSGGEQAIDGRDRSVEIEAAPEFSGFDRETEDTPSTLVFEGQKPAFEAECLGRIALAKAFDAATDFPDDQDAEVEFGFGDAVVPGRDLGIAASAFA